MSRITAEDKAAWIEALRSGKYKQGQAVLRRIERDGSATHCCLGVLSEIKGFTDPDMVSDGGLLYPHVAAIGCLTNQEINKLWNMNDSQRRTFAEIADYIEAKIPVA